MELMIYYINQAINIYMPKKFAPSHPHLMHKYSKATQRTYQTLKTNRNTIFQQAKMQSEILKKKLAKINAQLQLVKSSSEYYDSQHETSIINQEIWALKNTEQAINEQIQKCQFVESNTSGQEYFLWKKKKRVEIFDEKMTNLQKQFIQKKQKMDRQILQKEKEAIRIRREIQNIEEKVKNASVKKQPEEPIAPVIEEQVLIELRKDHEALKGNLKLKTQSRDILKRRILENIQSTQISLNQYYLAQVQSLEQELTQLKKEQTEKGPQVSPATISELSYSYKPLLEEYELSLQQIRNQISQQLCEATEMILKPLNWKQINLQNYWPNKGNSNTQDNYYQQYRSLQSEYLKNQQEIKGIEKELQQIISQTTTYKNKTSQLDLAINSIIKLSNK